MPPSLPKLASRLLAPLMTVGLLLGMVAEQRSYLREEDFAGYHKQALRAVEAIPRQIGPWAGSESTVPQEAQALLKPNAILALLYKDHSEILRGDRRLTLLVVQCRRSGDMVGHYPRNCYQSIGMEMTQATPRDFAVRHHSHGELAVPVIEYHFREQKAGRTRWTIVYNFMIVPARGLVRDMEGVRAAAEDYQQRYYGAAQFQVVFQDPLPQQDRDEIFTLFLRELVPTIKTLNSGVLR